VPPDKDLLLWPDAVDGGCPRRAGIPTSKDAAPSLALLEKGLLVSANYSDDTEIFGVPVPFGSVPMDQEVDRFVATVSEGVGGPQVAWATPVARTWHGGGGGVLLAAPLEDGFLVGGGIYGWLDKTYMPFTAGHPRLPVLARLTAAGVLVPSTPLSFQPGLLRSIEVHPGCALVAGVFENTDDLMWMTDAGVGPTFVALFDGQSLLPLGGRALRTDLLGGDPPQVFAARGDQGIVVAAVYRGEPKLGGTQLLPAQPLGTFLLRVVEP
jgi:hypothetical protein